MFTPKKNGFAHALQALIASLRLYRYQNKMLLNLYNYPTKMLLNFQRYPTKMLLDFHHYTSKMLLNFYQLDRKLVLSCTIEKLCNKKIILIVFLQTDTIVKVFSCLICHKLFGNPITATACSRVHTKTFECKVKYSNHLNTEHLKTGNI